MVPHGNRPLPAADLSLSTREPTDADRAGKASDSNARVFDQNSTAWTWSLGSETSAHGGWSGVWLFGIGAGRESAGVAGGELALGNREKSVHEQLPESCHLAP